MLVPTKRRAGVPVLQQRESKITSKRHCGELVEMESETMTFTLRMIDGSDRVQTELSQPGMEPMLHDVSEAAIWRQVERVEALLHTSFQQRGGTTADLVWLIEAARSLRRGLLSDEMLGRLVVSGEGAVRVAGLARWQAVPWELLPLSESAMAPLLGEQFAVGRVFSQRPPQDLPPHRPRVGDDQPLSYRERLRLPEGRSHETESHWGKPEGELPHQSHRARVVVADGRLGLARVELQSVRRHFEKLAEAHPQWLRGVETRWVDAHDVALDTEELSDLMRGCRCFHFIGHAVEREAVRVWLAGWPTEAADVAAQSADEPSRFFGPRDVIAAGRHDWPELVVAHACGSAAISSATRLDQQPIPSLAEALLAHGTRWYVGTLAPILDAQCDVVIDSFYAELGSGAVPAEALRRARQTARTKLPAGNLLPLMYVLYGEPEVGLGSSSGACSGSETAPPFVAQPQSHRETIEREFKFPAACARPNCGQVIATRHGVGRFEFIAGRIAAVCRQCHRK